MPTAMGSPPHRGEASSRRAASAALTLTTILELKSWPASRSRYVWLFRAKQYTQACEQPRYGLIVQLNGMREEAGSLLITERAWISKNVMPWKPGVPTRVVTAGASKRAGAAAAAARPPGPGPGGSRRLSQR